jgi:NAD(P)-dependent dehydrogenase (short-subunit alcohol dehydrogenase family)
MLKGKTAVVTGGSRGIGKAICLKFAENGADIAFLYAGNTVKAEETVKELEGLGVKAKAYQCNVADADAVAAVIKEIVKDFGGIQILVNNAGVCRLGSFLDMSDEDRDFHIDINIKGVWNVTKAVLPEMIARKDGRIVMMSSVTGDMVADPGETAYALTKAAIVGLTKSLAVEYAQSGIRVNAICPGYVRTPMAESIARQSNPEDPESVLTEMAKAIPMRRLADPLEVGELAAFLASDESSYLTGTQNVIDGGSTLPETVSVGI